MAIATTKIHIVPHTLHMSFFHACGLCSACQTGKYIQETLTPLMKFYECEKCHETWKERRYENC